MAMAIWHGCRTQITNLTATQSLPLGRIKASNFYILFNHTDPSITAHRDHYNKRWSYMHSCRVESALRRQLPLRWQMVSMYGIVFEFDVHLSLGFYLTGRTFFS
jgi:hypothetical protein